MAVLEISTEQVLNLIQQLPLSSKRSVLEVLKKELEDTSTSDVMDEESRTWLEADLSGELPEYDWGPEGMPEGLPVRYDAERGVAVIEGDTGES